MAEHLVVLGHLALALVHADLHLGLAVGGRREHLALARRDGRVARYELGEHAAECLDAERQRRHVEQQHVAHVAGQDGALDGGSNSHGLVRIDRLARRLAEYLLHGLLDLGHARHAADEEHLVDVGRLDLGVLDRLHARIDGALDERADDLLELSARHLVVHVLRAALVDGQVGQVDLRLRARRQLALGLLGRLAQTLHRLRVLGHVIASLFQRFTTILYNF